MKYKHLSAGFFLIVFAATLLSFTGPGDDLLGKLVDQLYKWRALQPVEKVYLHLDKSGYAIGDDIWFKAYVTIGSKHQLSAYSEILNVDLIDDNDSVKRSIKLPLTSGLAYGDFALADSMEEGNYRIRAYTNWMRNAGEAYFYDKTITVSKGIHNPVFTKATYTYSSQNGKQQVNAGILFTDESGTPYAGNEVSYQVELNGKIVHKGKGVTDATGNLAAGFATEPNLVASGHLIATIKLADKKTITKVIPVKAISNRVDVQFFPEGGNLVNGASSTVAFKAVGADGLGTDIKGTITDEENHEVGKFASTHLGMGIFDLKPETGRTYKAHITYADGSQGDAALPKATDDGYVLHIDNSNDDELGLRILPGTALLNSATPIGGLTLVAQSGGEIYYAGMSADGGKTFSNAVPKSKFPSGIVQFTLFSAGGEPLNERLVFIRNKANELKLDINTDKKSYGTRQKVTLNFGAKNTDGKPAIGSFSASVTDMEKAPVNETEESIFSNVLLTSDLKGYIENPGYYFSNVNTKTNADLDVLMLTQGYRRFEWKKIIADQFAPVVYQPEKTLEISGHVKTFGGKPVPNAKITLLTTAGGTFIIDTVTDDKGKFSFRNLIFKDSIKFVIQARTAKDRKSVDIDLDNIAPQVVGKNKNAADLQVNISDAKSVYLQNSKKRFNEDVKYGIGNHTIVLKEVVIKDKKDVTIKNSNNLNGAGNADQVITYKDLQNSTSQLWIALQMKINGVIFKNGVPYSTRSQNQAMAIFVDGIEVDKDYLNTMNTNDVEGVEVLRTIGNTAIYGFRGSGGVLVITTRRGGDGLIYNRYAPGVVTYAPKGYYVARNFYSPQYDDPKTNTQMADLRSTIYWNPNIVTDKDGNATMSFFNADGKGTYRILIEGIDADGNLAHQVYTYKVE